jgi:CHASE2 domain-containing sensor protein
MADDSSRQGTFSFRENLYTILAPLVVVLFVVPGLGTGAFQGLENLLINGRFKARAYYSSDPKAKGDEKVILVGIDEDSLASLGRWPWPRVVHGRLLEELAEEGREPGAVMFDLLFTEEEEGTVVETSAGDTAFGDAAAVLGNVVTGGMMLGGYDLSLKSVAAPADLADTGESLVIVALVGGGLHIRIFDADGKRVIPQISYGGVGTNITANFCGRFIDSPPLFPL